MYGLFRPCSFLPDVVDVSRCGCELSDTVVVLVPKAPGLEVFSDTASIAVSVLVTAE